MKKDYDILLDSLKLYFEDDQLKSLQNKSLSVKKWTNSTIKKAIMILSLGSSRALNYCRKFIAPLPCDRTVRRHLESFVIQPGILDIVIDVVRLKVENFTPTQLRMGLVIDEKAIVPGESLERKSKEYIGKATLPPGNLYADNVLVFLLVGIEIRVKEIVAYHLTTKKGDAEAQTKFLLELIKYIENNTDIKIDFITYDLGPANTSMLKHLERSLLKGEREPFISHPIDESRKLYLIPDPEHDLKNVVSAFRNSDSASIPNKFVQKYNLNSSKVSIKEVERLVKLQDKFKFKPAPKLDSSITCPTHFQKMHTSTFEELISPNVQAALDVMAHEKHDLNGKEYSLKWLFCMFHQWRNITAYIELDLNESESWDKLDFLMEMAEIFEEVKFGSRHKPCQTGAAWASIGIVDLIKFWYSLGMTKVKPSRVLQNSLESVFSMVASYQSSPSAYDFTQAMKKIIVTHFISDPIKGSYKWDEEAAFDSDFCFLDHLKLNKSNLNNTDTDISIWNDIEWPEDITSKNLFDKELELQTFFLGIGNILDNLFSKHSCDICIDNYTATSHEPDLFNSLFLLQSDCKIQPSSLFLTFCFKVEFIYRALEDLDVSSSVLKKKFPAVIKDKMVVGFNHCNIILDDFLSLFITYRLKIAHQARFVYRKQFYASQFK